MFVVMSVRDFPAWEPGEAEELDLGNVEYECSTPVSRWRDVAAVFVAAVTERPGPWDLDAWHAFGLRAGLSADAQGWFESLFLWPICVLDGGWSNGRHRVRVLELAGAKQVAVEDPDHVPE